MLYSITIYRFDEESNQTELFDQYITADQAIEALLFAHDLAPIEYDEEEQSEVEEEPEEAEEELLPTPTAPKGRRASYDKAGLEADIRANVLTTQEVAKKYDVTPATVYQARNKLKQADPVAVADDGPATTAYAQKQVGRSEVPTPDVNIEGEIKLAAMQGFSVSEIADMYPTVPLEKIAKIKAEANR